MWKCKNCGSEDIIGAYEVSTSDFYEDGGPDFFDCEIENCIETICTDCNAKGREIQDIANYIDDEPEA